MNILRIANGRVIDPSQAIDEVIDVWVVDSKVHKVGPEEQMEPTETIDATGMIVCPGLIDMHVHLREPGDRVDETIFTGSKAALVGGVTSVACMPNTSPAIDTQAAAEFIYLQAERANHANVFPIGAVTKGRTGEELAELGGLHEGGAVAFTDHDCPIASAEVMRRALEYCGMFDTPVLCHAEDTNLTRRGVMNEGFESMRLGVRGIPHAAEEVMIYRDIELARLTGGKLHILHVSTAGGVELIRRAKADGVRVTAEVCPHHFTLTETQMRSLNSNFKMAPPLRTQADMEAILLGLQDGTIDVIASDHSPLAPEKTMRELDLTPFGVIGLETLLPVCITKLIRTEILTWSQLIEKLTAAPANILGIKRGTLKARAEADITLIDPEPQWTIDVSKFESKSKNSPFDQWHVRGRAHLTIVSGQVRHVATSL
ncbi:MAG: dihydroorotase family protein [Gemmataceae bacterium]